MLNGKIIFFDGVCGLCNKSIDFLMRHDTQHNLKFSPLQGKTAEQLIPNQTQQMDTFIYWRDGKTYEKSGAILRALSDIGGLWNLAKILLIIPSFIRNTVYMWVSKRRYNWFGQTEHCRIPTPSERSWFLD